jgi:hypothetical protein
LKRLSGVLLALGLAFNAAAKPRSNIRFDAFDGKPSGARFIGLGEQGAAAEAGPESPLWNPAALHDIARPTFSADFDVARRSAIDENVLTGDLPLRGRKLTYLGFAAQDAAFFFRPLSNFNERTVTDVLDPANNFIDENLEVNQVGFSAASESQPGAGLGINLTYLNAHRSYAVAATGQPPVIDFADGNGFTLDLGLRRKWEQGSFGAAAFNIPGILYWNSYKPDQLPVLVRAGGSFYPVPYFGLLGEYEKRFYRGNVPQPKIIHLGLELTPLPWIQLRGGTYGEDLNDPNKVSYAAGVSAISPKGYQFDIALRSYLFQGERVYNYFLSLILPLPDSPNQEPGRRVSPHYMQPAAK